MAGKRKSPQSAQQARKAFTNQKHMLAQAKPKGRTYAEPWSNRARVGGEPSSRLGAIPGFDVYDPPRWLFHGFNYTYYLG